MPSVSPPELRHVVDNLLGRLADSTRDAPHALVQADASNGRRLVLGPYGDAAAAALHAAQLRAKFHALGLAEPAFEVVPLLRPDQL